MYLNTMIVFSEHFIWKIDKIKKANFAIGGESLHTFFWITQYKTRLNYISADVIKWIFSSIQQLLVLVDASNSLVMIIAWQIGFKTLTYLFTNIPLAID